MASKNRAFTVMEFVVSMLIVAIVAGITYPLIVRAKESAAISSSSSKLKQLYLAVLLYQGDYGSQAEAGSPAQMGLPSLAAEHSLEVATKTLWRQVRRSSCADKSLDGMIAEWNIYYRPFDESTWELALAKKGQGVRLFYDVNCDYSNAVYGDEYAYHRAIAVTLGGALVTQIGRGSPTAVKFWYE
jgi:prepilin-type N-terminal cleavage/methylation domain-containing protein